MNARVRAKNSEQVLRLIEEAGQQGISTEALAFKTGMTTRAVVSLCRDLQQSQRVVASNGNRHAGGRPVIWRELTAPTPLPARFPFKPLRTPRPTVIPVRAGGRLAPDIRCDEHVSFGPYVPNPYHPIKEDFAW